MIGEVFELQRRPPIGGAVFFAICLVLFALGAATMNPHWAVAALLPLTIAIALFCCRPRPFSAELTGTGILIHETAREIAYDAVTRVSYSGTTGAQNPARPQASPISVTHAGGHLWIPAPLNVPSDSLFKALFERCAPRESKRIPLELVEHVAEQQDQFGHDRVWVFEPRNPTADVRSGRCAIAVLAAFSVTGVLWSITGAFGEEFTPWVAGLAMTFIALFLMLAVWGGRTAKRRKAACSGPAGLVVSPVGIAMVQGDMTGKLLWGEIRSVQLRNKSKFLSVGNAGAHLAVDVAGAQIQILDIYDATLPQIADLMRRHLKPQQ